MAPLPELGSLRGLVTDDQVRMLGVKELEKTLEKIGDRVVKNTMRHATSKAAQVLVRAIRANVRQMVGRGSRQFAKDKLTRKQALSRTITKAPLRGKRRAVVGYVVGPKWPAGAHGHLVHDGHRVVIPAGQGKKLVDTGRRSKAIPFQARAMAESQGKMASTMASEAQKRLVTEVRKAVNRQIKKAAS